MQYPPPPQPGFGPPVFDPPALPVLASVAPSARQSRATVAFRAILMVPHLIVLYILGLVAGIAAIIGWFGALFTGRLPIWCGSYLTGYLRWYCRVLGYGMLLTDVYPPFSTDDDNYPIRFAIQPGRMSRLTVLFRFMLAIPAALLGGLLLYGTWPIVMFIAWLIALFTGRLPEPLHQALSAVLRFQARYLGYAYLVTATYPGGLFGDPQPAGYDFPGFAEPDPWRLTLTGAAKRLVTTFIVVGLLTIGGFVAWMATSVSSAVNATAADLRVTVAYESLSTELNATKPAQAACEQASNRLTCVQPILKKMSGDITSFRDTVADTGVPANAVADRQQLVADSTSAAAILLRLSSAATEAQYTSIENSSNLDGYLNGIDNGYQTLEQQLADDVG
jgi:hypothetical protein